MPPTNSRTLSAVADSDLTNSLSMAGGQWIVYGLTRAPSDCGQPRVPWRTLAKTLQPRPPSPILPSPELAGSQSEGSWFQLQSIEELLHRGLQAEDIEYVWHLDIYLWSIYLSQSTPKISHNPRCGPGRGGTSGRRLGRGDRCLDHPGHRTSQPSLARQAATQGGQGRKRC